MYGDVHVVDRAALGLFPYRHFGVEMQAGMISENSPMGIRIVPLPDFSRGGTTRVQNPGASAAERSRAIERAASRIGERRYSLTSNNCEHFANWCATGAAVSHQVIAFVKALIELAFAAALSFLVVTAARVATAE